VQLNLFDVGDNPIDFGRQGPAMELTSHLITIAFPGSLVGSNQETLYSSMKKYEDPYVLNLGDIVPEIMGFKAGHRYDAYIESDFRRAGCRREGVQLWMDYSDSLRTNHPRGVPERNSVTARYIFMAQISGLVPYTGHLDRQYSTSEKIAMVVSLEQETGESAQKILRSLHEIAIKRLAEKIIEIFSLIHQARTVTTDGRMLANTVYLEAQDGRYTTFRAWLPNIGNALLRDIALSNYIAVHQRQYPT